MQLETLLIVKSPFEKFKRMFHTWYYIQNVHVLFFNRSIYDILRTCRLLLPLVVCTSNLICSYFTVTAHRLQPARLLTSGYEIVVGCNHLLKRVSRAVALIYFHQRGRERKMEEEHQIKG